MEIIYFLYRNDYEEPTLMSVYRDKKTADANCEHLNLIHLGKAVSGEYEPNYYVSKRMIDNVDYIGQNKKWFSILLNPDFSVLFSEVEVIPSLCYEHFYASGKSYHGNVLAANDTEAVELVRKHFMPS